MSARLDHVLDLVVATLADATGHEAGVLIRSDDGWHPSAASGVAADRLDRLRSAQDDVAPGPVRLPDDRRPELSRAAAEYDVRAVLGVPLGVDGLLTLYARGTSIPDQDVTLATVCGAVAAPVLAEARHADHLHAALRTRDLIGQAKGILIERHRISAENAFELLSVASQRSNQKLADVAAALVENGRLAGSPTRRPRRGRTPA
ncbi:ANTAR domain-containing protein [Cryptosporangium aurantiacum]|uniref:GAF domain-containing protein n=1 Tax=Cryptosporangium aurantiacum TaxID=134849 RepID=A0A1M7RFW9_9ACTN|nr:ANTAR domain-containing protein [Cryptosporangium aurantiacum]SHN45086.1 GAF domain-containing protein [Cryptosporangium aurantiacum]